MRVYTNDTLVRTENESPLFGKQILIKNLNLKKQYLLLNINDKKKQTKSNLVISRGLVFCHRLSIGLNEKSLKHFLCILGNQFESSSSSSLRIFVTDSVVETNMLNPRNNF